MSSVVLTTGVLFLLGMTVSLIVYTCAKSTMEYEIPVSHTPISPAPAENTVPFSYNVPVDSHMNYKKDVVIVVEHPDERIAVGMVAR
jgi:hypothetical protein